MPDLHSSYASLAALHNCCVSLAALHNCCVSLAALHNSCRTCFMFSCICSNLKFYCKFYCMFYFTCDRSCTHARRSKRHPATHRRLGNSRVITIIPGEGNSKTRDGFRPTHSVNCQSCCRLKYNGFLTGGGPAAIHRSWGSPIRRQDCR